MASRVKDDEKNERIIRNLLRLPDNRRCINCNSLGPQYVCTNFSTFVCTTCSGIHREFTHRVKSVSMAKFTSQEVSALQGGGNASAREIYLKEWDSQRNSLPDGSNIERLRDFIKHVYVDRRYTGERSVEKPPRAKMGETEEFNGNRRADNYQGGSRSPPYDNTSERRYGDRSGSGGRSPSYDQNNRQSSDFKKSPAREVVNDWRREDRFGNGRRSDERSSDGSSKFESRSPDHQRDSPISSPPVVRPVRDILGDNVSPLRVIEPPKTTSGKSTDVRATQRTASSSSLASSDANPSEIKVEASFIDFDAVPEPPTVTVQQTQVAADASSVPVTTSSSNDWANFDSLPNVKATAPASNSVESLLSGLSVPASSSGPVAPPDTSSSFSSSGIQGSLFESSFGNIAPPSVVPTGGAPVSSFGSAPTNFSSGGQWPTMNPQQSMFPGGIEQPVSGGSSTNKSWNPLMPNAYGPPGASTAPAQVGQAETAPAPATGRNALPEDLFSMNYSYNPSPVQAWYPGAAYGSRVPMHYNTPMAVGNYQAMPMPTSINPFDVNEPSPVQAPAFPSMASLHGALPKTASPSGNLHTPNYGYTPTVRAQTPSYSPTMPTSSFMGHEMAGSSMAPRPQGLPGFGFDDSAFASLNTNAQAGGLHAGAHPASSNFSTTSGNPFG